MKKLAAILFVCLTANSFSQTNIPPQFSELKGMEDQLGNTHLFYRIYTAGSGSMGYYYSNSIWRLEPFTGINTFFLGDGGFADQFDQVNDLEFWGNDFERYTYAGTHIYIEPFPEVHRYDQLNPIFAPQIWGVSRNIELSKQDTNLIMFSVDNGFNYKSTDWGNNWDSVSIGFEILSLSPFNDKILFANQVISLLKSTDGGNTFFTVDTGKIYSPNFIYDNDVLHIYALSNRFGSHLIVSNNKGEPFSWQTKYSSDSEIFISIDESTSGTIYLADKKNIFISTNYGNNFSLYKTLDRKIVGIYKKSNSNKLYAVTKYKIYEITPDTVQMIKSLPIPQEILNFYPLAIGNKWIYNTWGWWWDGTYHSYSGITSREVVGDSIMPNGKFYYKLNDPTTMNYPFILFERIDTTSGKVFRYDNTLGLPDDEYLIEDLFAEVGDSIWSSRHQYQDYAPFICIDERPYNFWGIQGVRKIFTIYDLTGFTYSLAQGIGVDSMYSSFDFGENFTTLKGCIIDGIVYGDTTTVGIEDEETPMATEFRLEQNYPNPFNPNTVISYQLPVISNVTLKVYDILGNEIATLVNEEKPAGTYEVEFNSHSGLSGIRDLPSGIYFYQLLVSAGRSPDGKAGSFIQTKKMVLLK